MTENVKLNYDIADEAEIIQVFDRAVKLFEKTGLYDLAEKWSRILKTYTNREHISDLI
ncbi:MAG: hypothetical protein ACFFFB_05315 [Candidatus Heimdallarchaeota archaeon]